MVESADANNTRKENYKAIEALKEHTNSLEIQAAIQRLANLYKTQTQLKPTVFATRVANQTNQVDSLIKAQHEESDSIHKELQRITKNLISSL